MPEIQRIIECRKLIPPETIRRHQTKEGKTVVKAVNPVKIAIEYISLFFRRLSFCVKTGNWPNLSFITKMLLGELRLESVILENKNLHTSALLKKHEIIAQFVNLLVERQLCKKYTPEMQRLVKECCKQISAPDPSISSPASRRKSMHNCGTPAFKKTPFPLKEDKLEELTPLTRKEYSNNIKKKLKQDRDCNTYFFDKADQLFDESWNRALHKAREIHEEFKSKYDLAGTIKLINTNQNTVTRSSLTQLDNAVRMVKEKFPHLTTLAYNSVQSALVARLIQIVLAGPPAAQEPLPKTDLCFELAELDGKLSKPLNISLNNFKTFIDCQFVTFQPPKQGQDADEHLQSNLNKIAAQFIKDCLINTETQFEILDKVYQVSSNSTPESIEISVFEIIRNLYSQYLLANPDEIKKAISNQSTSILFNTILKLYPPTPSDLLQTTFPKSCFESLFSPFIALYSKDSTPANRIVFNRLRAFIDGSNFDPTLLNQLAEKSKCDIRDIEPLMRKKLLELMIIMNESLHALSKQEVSSALIDEEKTTDPNLTSIPLSIKFIFKTDNFNTLTSLIRFKIVADYEEGTFADSYFLNSLGAAEIQSQIHIPSFNTPAQPLLHPFTNLKLGWLPNRVTWEKIALRFNPAFLNDQPSYQAPIVKAELKEKLQNLKIFNEIKDDQDIFFDENGKIQLMDLKKSSWWGGADTIASPDPERLNEIDNYLSDISQIYYDYKKICIVLNKKTEKMDRLFADTLKEVINGLSTLIETYEAFNLEVSKIMDIQAKIQKKLDETKTKYA